MLKTRMRIRFADAIFDSGLRELSRGGNRVALTPKAFALLEALIQARPQPISREALGELLWPDTIVEQGNLHNLVSEIRGVLGDDDHAIIRTVHRFGYAFDAAGVADVTAQFVVIVGREEIFLRQGVNPIGRDPNDTICINAPEVSRHHARIIVDGDRVTLEDLGSKNGTYLGTVRVTSPVELRAGDEFTIGKTLMVLRESHDLPSTKTAT
jgi:DNA-binding winged helix-turn-helix (wHTH) protein